MRKLLTFTVCLIGFSSAFAQTFTGGYTARNLPGVGVRFATTVNGLPSLHTGKRIALVSNNTTMTPPMGNSPLVRMFMGNGTKLDTITVSVLYPQYLFGNVTTIDSNANDTATAVPFMPVLVTPPFLAPKDSLLSQPSFSTNSASFSGLINGGNDTTYFKVVPSFGDTTFANPSWGYAADSQVFSPVLGTSNQWQSFTSTISIGAAGFYCSYRIIIWNSKGADTSVIFKGKTQPLPMSGTVSTPFNIRVESDSIISDALVNTGNLAGMLRVYDAACSTCAPVDSFVVAIPAATNVIAVNDLIARVPVVNANYWRRYSYQNTMMSVPYTTVPYMIHVKAIPETFTLAIDSIVASGKDSVNVFLRATVPGTDSATNITLLLAPTSDSSNLLHIRSLGIARSGVNFTTVMLNKVVVNSNYMVTVYGNDVRFTKMYIPWEVQRKFTFVGKKLSVQEGPMIASVGISPQPVRDGMMMVTNVSFRDMVYRIYDMLGREVMSVPASKGKRIIDVRTLSPGLYTLGGIKFVIQ